jgi:hypothetical protein
MDEHQKKFLKILNHISYGHSSVLNDWAEMAAVSLHNAVMPCCKEWTEREDRYLQIVKQYSGEELTGMCQMLACVVNSLGLGIHDCLGEMYMSEELRSRWDSDVCFTPFELSYMIAKMTFGDDPIPEKGYLAIGEPAAGTGGMVIAAAKVLKDLNLNYQRVMHVTATEIRAPLAHMAYIQMSLLHIPAVIIHGDSLALEEWSRWRTPAHILGFWEGKAGRYMVPMPKTETKVIPTEPQITFNFGKEELIREKATRSLGRKASRPATSVPARRPASARPQDAIPGRLPLFPVSKGK